MIDSQINIIHHLPTFNSFADLFATDSRSLVDSPTILFSSSLFFSYPRFTKYWLNNPALANRIPNKDNNLNLPPNKNKSAMYPVATPAYPKGIINEGFFSVFDAKIQYWEIKPKNPIETTSPTI